MCLDSPYIFVENQRKRRKMIAEQIYRTTKDFRLEDKL